MTPCRWPLWWVEGEGSRPRCPALFFHVWLHLVRVRLLLLVLGILELVVALRQPVGEVRLHIVGVLVVVHGLLLWHERKAVH
jgi:hypothetical protein